MLCEGHSGNTCETKSQCIEWGINPQKIALTAKKTTNTF